MTEKERQDYNELTHDGKEAYDRDVQKHPEHSHSQHLFKAKMEDLINKQVDKGDKDIIDDNGNPDPGILKDMLEEASEWLKAIGGISLAVLSALDDAISELGRAIGNGIRWIGNKIGDFFDWIFS